MATLWIAWRKNCPGQKDQLENIQTQIENSKAQVAVPSPQEYWTERKSARLDELNVLLNMDHKEPEVIDEYAPDEELEMAAGAEYSPPVIRISEMER